MVLALIRRYTEHFTNGVIPNNGRTRIASGAASLRRGALRLRQAPKRPWGGLPLSASDAHSIWSYALIAIDGSYQSAEQ
eukprot:4983758-Pleurochrysis_carterae.AAC.1